MSPGSTATKRIPISSLPDHLLSVGTYAFTVQDAAHAAQISAASALPALSRLVKKYHAFSPTRGLYLAIPPEYRSWGTLPGAWFIDPMMAHLERSYYVGLLSAAEQHGVAQQRPQAFQVVVNRELRNRSFGRVRLRFFTHANAASLPVQPVNVPTGTMAVSTPELTAFDLAHRPTDGGGLNNVATVVGDLASESLDIEKLCMLVEHFPLATGRRLGWLLEELTDLSVDLLAERVSVTGSEPAKLDPHGPRRGHVDKRWCLRINADVEPDR